ncbi:MAG: hypothetical protein EOO45_17765 [Flavobacterium sp.]|nr:MAG: hypothetical protein EOO45_17765 [Flavobacterium sp.]
MIVLPDFKIADSGEISQAFAERGIATFRDAYNFVKLLPYGRNEDKSVLTKVFTDGRGTCSTKHALLKLLADENGQGAIKLMMGIFRMNGVNTPLIAEVLLRSGLEYIPEAHNYLTFHGVRYDFTSAQSKLSDFESELLEETDMLPEQIGDYKVRLHKNYLKQWLVSNKNINLSLDELWAIREECIACLSKNRNTGN